MDETTEKVSPPDDDSKFLESPKPVAFTVDFGENRPLDAQRFKNMVEKYQNRHRRGQSLSKIEEPAKTTVKKPPLTGNLPRKAGYHMEGYYSSDEKMEKFKAHGVRSSVLNSVMKKGDLTLPLKPITTDRMTQSYPSRSFDLPVIDSPEVEIKDISSPELEPMSPISPLVTANDNNPEKGPITSTSAEILQNSESSSDDLQLEKFMSCVDLTDKTDTLSETGTYTIEADNYTEEQKQRMSIDKDFNIEQVSVLTKTREYIQSLILGSPTESRRSKPSSPTPSDKSSPKKQMVEQGAQINLIPEPVKKDNVRAQILSHNIPGDQLNNISNRQTKVLNSKPKDIENDDENGDKGVFTLVTTSGVLNKRQQSKPAVKNQSLVKSVIAVETFPTSLSTNNGGQVMQSSVYMVSQHPQSDNVIQRLNDSPTARVRSMPQGYVPQNVTGGDAINVNSARVIKPPSVGGSSGKNSPSKLPSPIHKPRNRSSYSSNCDFSDSSLETESYLKPTQNIITSLQQRLSLDSDSENDHDKKYNVRLNNEAKLLLKSKPVHVRHNSFDDRNVKMPNKLEHFHNKNLQGIDQTFKACNQYTQNKTLHQIQNSPNNSPIRRSSSFSLKNQFDNQPKCLNTQINKDNNFKKTTIPPGSSSIQRSSSTANIKPKTENLRRASINSDSHVVDRNSYLETDTSSEDDFDKTIVKHKKDLTSTRYNRAFSLRRARLDIDTPPPKCPNTPEMRRKFGPAEKSERTVSVDRKPSKSADVQSRYMNITKQPKTPPKTETPKPAPKCPPKPQPSKTNFSRTDSGRFSLRSPKPVSAGLIKPPIRREQQAKKTSGPRSNSTLSSREVEFQNWKRRKSYDPMKAAAEGKRKAELARKQIMTQSYNENSQEYDSSPSHSSSVHRSQSFHGTAALEQGMSSEDEDLTLSGDEGFSPPTPSPCELSPSKSNLRHTLWREKFNAKH